jgi:hypothetical protein
MTDLKSQLQIVLQGAGYSTWLGSVDGLDIVGFEDDTVMGFACIFNNVIGLLKRWRTVETSLLRNHASSLQRAGEKTWNVYSVFLSADTPDEVQAREVRWIEEDLERTRKIAACRVNDQQTLVTALLPLLPIQNQPLLDHEDFDVTKRLRKRIGTIAPTVTNAALDDKISATEVIRLLGVES